MASDIWLRTILIVRKETCCRPIGYSFRLTARVLLYAPSHRQDSTYHSLCYTSHGTRNSSVGSPHEDRSDDPSHHERTLLPWSYISLPFWWSAIIWLRFGRRDVARFHPTRALAYLKECQCDNCIVHSSLHCVVIIWISNALFYLTVHSFILSDRRKEGIVLFNLHLIPNSRYNFQAGVLLNTHSFILSLTDDGRKEMFYLTFVWHILLFDTQ